MKCNETHMKWNHICMSYMSQMKWICHFNSYMSYYVYNISSRFSSHVSHYVYLEYVSGIYFIRNIYEITIHTETYMKWLKRIEPRISETQTYSLLRYIYIVFFVCTYSLTDIFSIEMYEIIIEDKAKNLSDIYSE